jgi:indole-3-glycerol phosphate synthase
MPAYLDTIIAAHRAGAAVDGRDLEELLDGVGTADTVRPFRDALTEAAVRQGMAVISEIKRRSPSKGDLDPTLDPATVAHEYEGGGATCLSVLTDGDFFGGSAQDLVAARSACSLPVLRKDFTVGPLDVVDARLMGADAVLLIVAALTDDELASFLGLARTCSLTALVEVHDDLELARAVDAGAEVVGVNQRDLRTFEVDHQRALRLGEHLPDHVTAVAESGIQGPDDVRRLADAGYQAVLVGELLVRSGDRRTAVAELLGVGA